jgi:hypothetical protein
MQELLQKSNINDLKLKALIVRSVSKNLSSLSEPCFYPEIKKHYYEFLKLTGLTEADIREFVKRRWKGRPEYKFLIVKDTIANFYIFLLQYFLKKRDIQTYNYLMVLYVIRHYSALMHKHFKFCNADVFKYALETLTKTHLFVREKTIGNALYYMGTVLAKKWQMSLKNNDITAIGKFMQESRHRISQSIKSFAQNYYRISEEGIGIKTEETPDDSDENEMKAETGPKTSKLIDDISKKITVYKFIDVKSFEIARNITKVNKSIADKLVNSLNNIKYSNNIRMILKLFLDDIKHKNQICGKEYEKYLRGLMSIKRTSQEIYFKQQISILVNSLVKDINQEKMYKSLTNQTQFLTNLFIAYYITLLVRRTICPGV